MEEPTLKDAAALIERMKGIRPTCDNDERVAFGEAASARHAEITADNGWEPDPLFAAYFKRCPTCSNTIKYPWAGRLDAERVLAHMKTKNSAWCLDELEAFV